MRPAAVVGGAILYALSLPPFDWSVCAWLTLIPLLWVVRGVPTASAFRYGVLYGYASGWAATWCFADAAMRYFQLPFPLAVTAMALAYLAACGLPFGLFAAASGAILRMRSPREAGVLIPAAWAASEFLRCHILQQPWGLLGYTQHAQLGLIQVASVTGIYGVSFVLATGNVVLAQLLHGLSTRRRGISWAFHTAAIPAAIVTTCWMGGSLAMTTRDAEGGPMRRVAVVQTSVAPKLHWTRAYTDAQVAAHIRATEALPPGGASLIVWPENSVPRYLESEPMLAVELGTLAARQKADLLFGGPRYAEGQTFNAARLVTATGRNGGYYDKRRLVLFAEEKPLTFASHAGMNESPEQFSPGTESGVLQSFVPIGVSICHEIVHPDLIRASVRDGAEVLVNIANDGWLDGGYHVAGPQHLAMAVLRAVETRRFVVRAATTGPSAVIDPFGRVEASLAPDTSGVLIAGVRGERTTTPYVRFGDAFAVLCALVVCARLAHRPWRFALRQSPGIEAPVAS